MVFKKKEFKRSISTTPQFLKSEWNMAQLDFWRFHQLFDNADELGFMAHNFIGGSPLSSFDDWLGILRVIYSNFKVFMKKEIEQTPIDKLITLIFNNLVSLNDRAYTTDELFKVYKQIESLHQKLLAIKVKMNLTFKWQDGELDEDEIKNNILEALKS